MPTRIVSALCAHFGIYIVLFVLIVLGAILRFVDLSQQPYWMDEGYTVNAVLSIAETGSSVLDSGLPYSCPVYCFPTAWLANTFGHDATTYRLPAAIFGVLLIPLFFLIGRFLFIPSVGLLTAFFISFEYFQLAWSRQARWYTLFAFLFWLALYAFYRAYYTKKHRLAYSALSVGATILAILTHGLGYLLPFIMLSWVLIDTIFIKRSFSWRRIGQLLLLGICIVVILELAFGTTRFSRLFTDFTLYNVAPFYLAYYLSTYLPFILLGLVALYRMPKHWRIPSYFLLFVALSYTIPLFFLTDIVHYRYAWHLTPILFLLASLGTYRLLTLRPHFLALGGSIIAGALLLFMSTLTFTPPDHYWLEADDPAYERLFPGTEGYYAYTPQPDWNSAYAFLAQKRDVGDTIISSHPHFNKIFLEEAGYWLGYRYHGLSELPSSIRDGREYYVGALVIGSLPELQSHTNTRSGYIIFDYMAADGRIPEETLRYIRRELALVYHDRLNSYSQIWIYRFK